MSRYGGGGGGGGGRSRGGAEYLAGIHGTEEDKVNCPFYYKIGACRHGDKCSRQHHRPPFSETILIKHMWNNPMCDAVSNTGNFDSVGKDALQQNLDEFYEEICEELAKYGKIEDIQVCENLNDHMVGNVYVKYFDEEDSEKALVGMSGRFYAGRQMNIEYSPVTDFKEARCRQYDDGTCTRGPYCNFMHVCEPSKELRDYLRVEFGFRGGRMKGTGGMDNLNRRRAPPASTSRRGHSRERGGGYERESSRGGSDYRDRDRDRERR